jgi:hypothetical protein
VIYRLLNMPVPWEADPTQLAGEAGQVGGGEGYKEWMAESHAGTGCRVNAVGKWDDGRQSANSTVRHYHPGFPLMFATWGLIRLGGSPRFVTTLKGRQTKPLHRLPSYWWTGCATTTPSSTRGCS